MTYYVAGLPYSAELYHYGIQGQKWGLRRFQNPDGTRTPEGKIRYRENGTGNSGSASSNGKNEKLKKAAKIALITAGTAAAAYGTYRLAKSGALNDVASKIGNTARSLSNGTKSKIVDSISRHKADRELNTARSKENAKRMKDAINAFKIPDDELLSRIGRLEKEAEYRKLILESIEYTPNPKNKVFVDAGKKVAGTFLAGAGTYAIKALLTKKFSPKEAADYVAPKPKKK